MCDELIGFVILSEMKKPYPDLGFRLSISNTLNVQA